ncbi:MAG: glycoside hydrolase family 1 protein [Clostridia bacterium]|nr:glycoside hydrolase family 1 protein [Clostridia bacterium]
MVQFNLPENFLMGTATASVQIEGGDTNNTWYQWCEKGRIKDSSSCITANDHWNRVHEDIRLLKELNVKTHRMSIEWSRIQPAKGQFSEEALLHYREELSILLANEIHPLVTLHHFSEPIWFHELGAWERDENIEYFLEFVRYVIEKLGDLVCDWITFNEPNVYTAMGYASGIWPPGESSASKVLKVQSSLIKAHVKAYEVIHSIREYKEFPGQTKVGCAMHIRVFEGVGLFGKLVAWVADYFFNHLLFDGTATGRLGFPLSGKGCRHKPGKYIDFIGINYYTRNVLKFAFKPSSFFYEEIEDNKYPKTDSGWDIYPEGLYKACQKYYKKYQLPIYITENGINDQCDDKKMNFICSHLSSLYKAIREGIPVKRYYYWTLMDNFEWHEGETTRFGLVSCNFRNQQRKMRKSGWFYSQICKFKRVTPELLKKAKHAEVSR